MTTALQHNATVDVTYSSGYNARAVSSQPSIDRARGGTVSVTLVIPEKTHNLATKDGGTVTIPEVRCTFTIDMEQLPLVDTSRYKVEETQIAPDEMPYPAALPNDTAPLTHTFG